MNWYKRAQQESIDRAATRDTATGEVFTHGRGSLHGETAALAMAKKLNKTVDEVFFSNNLDHPDLEHGFTTSTGRFVNREEAASIAGQEKELDTMDLPDIDQRMEEDELV